MNAHYKKAVDLLAKIRPPRTKQTIAEQALAEATLALVDEVARQTATVERLWGNK